ncbi:major facilitator superfamily domain-containing protein [Mycena sp. CBHHK59/15]|nr:major facilitator superfamily domain-containing protein [Mycena sp. CBHHK59/15]
MGLDLIRDSTVGQFVNFLSGGRLLPYADERPGYVVPSHFLPPPSSRPVSVALSVAPKALDEVKKDNELPPDAPKTASGAHLLKSWASRMLISLAGMVKTTRTTQGFSPYCSRFVDELSLRNRNWSFVKRVFVSSCISFLTFSVYIGSPIYTASIPGIMEEFHVSLVHATLGLTLYIVGYGIGPIFLAPLQEIPAIGRTPVYIYSLLLFVVLQVPIITARNIQVILVLRFFTGFFGGLAPATGGASMADMFPLQQLPYVMGIWSLFAIAGPIAGPIAGSFAAQANGWRWPMYELLWISGFALIFLALLLPETYEPTILLKKARRLRKLAGNDDLHTAAEQEQESQTAGEIMYEAFVRPFVLMTEPVLAFTNVYLGFVYALFYLWFESFPLVFTDIYHFNFAVSSLPFLGYLVTGILTYVVYCIYQKYHIAPRYIRAAMANKTVQPEIRLEIGLMASLLIPASVLIFGFTSRASIHWIVPTIGASLYLPGLFLNFQSILIYITSAYPAYAASALAGNDLFRSVIASVFPLFGRAFFHNLGLGPGSALLAGVSLVLMVIFWLLFKYGHILRARSKYAHRHH